MMVLVASWACIYLGLVMIQPFVEADPHLPSLGASTNYLWPCHLHRHTHMCVCRLRGWVGGEGSNPGSTATNTSLRRMNHESWQCSLVWSSVLRNTVGGRKKMVHFFSAGRFPIQETVKSGRPFDAISQQTTSGFFIVVGNA
ncbi:hypothetical protein GGS23DRAFT_555770 [Durotheca rogersii]|uniref:uncharacterized protein n=1 Tax=Durotheca rogersii TaxID=419775 RepID=UPI0022210B69|nr:uncharacterized protein GGS23DRAFT_555770 [Durotheca rogersii]KAI5866159.1 hypothetical protein GGS23DRAFT_555770 [Durotheca rogersii]